MKKPKEYNLSLLSGQRTVLMGLSALWIVFFHCYSLSFGFLHFSPLEKALDALRSTGRIGVDILLLLSGIGLYYSMERDPSVRSFYKKRAIRILPSALLVSAISYALFYEHSSAIEYFEDVFFISFFTRGERTFWFFGLIIVLYLLFPLIYRVLKRRHTAGFLVMLAAVLVLNALLLILVPDYYGMTEIAFARIPVFLAGAWLGKFVMEGRCLPFYRTLTAALAATAASFALFFVCGNFLHSHFYILRLLLSVPAVGLSVLLSMLFKHLKPGFLRSVLSFFGRYSMEIYLMFAQATIYTAYLMTPDDSCIVFYTAAFVITIITSVLLKMITERMTDGR